VNKERSVRFLRQINIRRKRSRQKHQPKLSFGKNLQEINFGTGKIVSVGFENGKLEEL
jgi:hypothetical protein